GLQYGITLLLGDDTIPNQLRCQLLPDRWMGPDRVVHQRLGEERLVTLVVAPPPVSYQVDKEVLAVALAVRGGQPSRHHTRLDIVGVDVNYRDLETLGEVARIPGLPR